MFGLHDAWIAGAYLLSILSSLICVIYGLKNWNSDNDEPVAKSEDAV